MYHQQMVNETNMQVTQGQVDFASNVATAVWDAFVKGQQMEFETNMQVNKAATETLEKGTASTVNSLAALTKGGAKVLENFWDFLMTYANYKNTNDIIEAGILVGQIDGEDIPKMWESTQQETMMMVAEDHVENIYNKFYTTDFGKWANNTAWNPLKIGGAVTGLIEGVGRTLGIIGMAAIGNIGVVPIAGISGMAEGMEQMWQNTGTDMTVAERYNSGLMYGGISGTWEAIQWGIGKALQGKSILSVATDTAFGGVDPYVKSMGYLTASGEDPIEVAKTLLSDSGLGKEALANALLSLLFSGGSEVVGALNTSKTKTSQTIDAKPKNRPYGIVEPETILKVKEALIEARNGSGHIPIDKLREIVDSDPSLVQGWMYLEETMYQLYDEIKSSKKDHNAADYLLVNFCEDINEKIRGGYRYYKESDGIRIYKPWDSDEEIDDLAENVIKELAKIPDKLKRDTNIILVSDFCNPNCVGHALMYNLKRFQAAGVACYDLKEITIYPTNDVPSTLPHELAHIYDYANNITKNMEQEWRKAIKDDMKFNKMHQKGVTDYATMALKETNEIIEDFAESVQLLLSNPEKFKEQYPARYDILMELLE